MIRKTRYPEFGFEQYSPRLWRIVVLPDGCVVGPLYASKAELLADLSRYARDYGVEEGPALPYAVADYRRALDGEGPLAGYDARQLLLDLCNAVENAGI